MQTDDVDIITHIDIEATTIVKNSSDTKEVLADK